MATRATASVTLAWSAGIVATVRYYQLAAPTAATPTVPTSSSSLGSWTETEPTADVTKVLWTCERTVYADGTESWSKASKSTSYEAAKDAKSTATDAQAKAAALSTLIRQTDAGVEVGKSTDGKTYATNRALMSSSGAFQVLDKGGAVLANFDADSVDLGGESSSVNLLGGKGVIETTSTPINGESQATLGLRSDFVQVVASGDSTGCASLEARYDPWGNYTRLTMTPEDLWLSAKVNDLRTNGLMVNSHEVFLCEMLHFKRVVTASDYLKIHGFVLGSTIVDVLGLAVVAVYWKHGRFHSNAWGGTTLATFDGWWCDDDFNFPAEPDASSMVLQGIHDTIVFRSTKDQDTDGWVSGCLCFPVHRR